MKYAIWGAGHRGEIIYKILGDEKISCFIDTNPEKTKKKFCGKTVYSYENYKKNKDREIVIVSPGYTFSIVQVLDIDSIPYFSLEECPAEFMGYGTTTAKKYQHKLLDTIDDHGVLYGISLYTLWLHEQLKMQGKYDISIIPQRNVNKNLLKKLLSEIEGLNIIDIKQAETEKKKIFVCFYDDFLNPVTIPYSYIDIFDLSKRMIPYKNIRIEKFREIHNGERCFIIATGPSLRIDDLKILDQNKEFCISMNSIFYLFDRTSWRPNCYCVIDGTAIDAYRNGIMNIPVDNVFLADSSIKFDYTALPENYYIFHYITGKYFLDNPVVPNDFSQTFYTGGSVTNACIQLAMYMGFKEIYLLGVDFNFKLEKKHCTSDIDKHGDCILDSFLSDYNRIMLNIYNAIRVYANSHDIHIYNATRGGDLEVFERVNFDRLF